MVSAPTPINHPVTRSAKRECVERRRSRNSHRLSATENPIPPRMNIELIDRLTTGSSTYALILRKSPMTSKPALLNAEIVWNPAIHNARGQPNSRSQRAVRMTANAASILKA